MARKSRRIPLSEWTDRGLHATAGRLRRILSDGEITRKQDWLLTMLINEMEHRYDVRHRRGMPVAPESWVCYGCDLCHSDDKRMPGQMRLLAPVEPEA